MRGEPMWLAPWRKTARGQWAGPARQSDGAQTRPRQHRQKRNLGSCTHRFRIKVALREVNSRHVEEGEVSLVLDDVGDLLPLFLGGIDTGRVVRAGMEEHNGASWRILPRAS
jgi:hypothetical protein